MPRYQMDDSLYDDLAVVQAGTAAFGLYGRCGSYSAQHLLDGFVPSEIAAMYGSPEWIGKLTAAGLWDEETGGYRDTRWSRNGNPLRSQVLADRAKKVELRNPMILKAVRDRDGDWCRYCGHKVNWNDRRGTYGATYDHVVPGLLAGAENLVVACRSCNSAKRDRTPEEAGLTLLNPRTQIRPGSDLGQTRNRPRSDLTPNTSPNGDVRAPARAHARGAGGAPKPPPPLPVEAHEYKTDRISSSCESCGLPKGHRVHQSGGTEDVPGA
jgi:5-methylcytosine-specific restriction endonuclease McrA